MSHRRSPLLALLIAILACVLAASPAAGGTMVIVGQGDGTQKVVALTFDDGWSPTRTARIVAILDRKGVPATFLPYAEVVMLNPTLWRSIARQYPIANHSTTHPHLTRLTSRQVFREIDGARRTVERITGRPMVRMFRPPYGSRNATVDAAAYRAGFKMTVLWNVDSRDWERNISDERVYRLATAGGKGSIVLLHAGPAVTVRVLPRIIDAYRQRGFRFVTLPQMFGWT
jgi:peptidoglycan/xylan/chitin deacetylase (PgdA/CDA1 family)